MDVGSGTEPPGPRTFIVCVVVALWPYAPTTPFIERICVPTSLAEGVHENEPPIVMLPFETVVTPVNVSLTVNAVGTKLMAFTLNDTVCPGETFALGETEGIASDGPAPTKTNTLAELLCPSES